MDNWIAVSVNAYGFLVVWLVFHCVFSVMGQILLLHLCPVYVVVLLSLPPHIAARNFLIELLVEQ